MAALAASVSGRGRLDVGRRRLGAVDKVWGAWQSALRDDIVVVHDRQHHHYSGRKSTDLEGAHKSIP